MQRQLASPRSLRVATPRRRQKARVPATPQPMSVSAARRFGVFQLRCRAGPISRSSVPEESAAPQHDRQAGRRQQPRTPNPGTTRTSETSPLGSTVPRRRANSTMARDIGMDRRRCQCSWPWPGFALTNRSILATKRETAARPVVSVPVLSNRIAGFRPAARAPRRCEITRPDRPHCSGALQTASGAARPRAHGQAIRPTARQPSSRAPVSQTPSARRR